VSSSRFQCSICKNFYPAAQLTAFQKWVNGRLEQAFKCHECQEKTR